MRVSLERAKERTKHAMAPASMTVEASYVMATVIIALAVLIRTAYGQCARTTGVMKLHWRVEQMRYQEEDQERSLDHGQVARKSGKVEGYVQTAGWEKAITAGVYEPEEALRLITIFEPDD